MVITAVTNDVLIIYSIAQRKLKKSLISDLKQIYFCFVGDLRPFSFCVYRISMGSVVSGTLATGN